MTKLERPEKILKVQPLLLAFALVIGIGGSAARGADSSLHEKKVLPSSRFSGRAALGYEAAGKAPELCAKLFCYCGCDMTDAHTNLLDCFTGEHGTDCQICQDEAIMALHMLKEGKTTRQIQQSIDSSFSSQYPWDKPSGAFLSYQKSIGVSSGKAGAEPVQSGDAAKLKDKASLPRCCGPAPVEAGVKLKGE